jgi:hypothetical protein
VRAGELCVRARERMQGACDIGMRRAYDQVRPNVLDHAIVNQQVRDFQIVVVYDETTLYARSISGQPVQRAQPSGPASLSP